MTQLDPLLERRQVSVERYDIIKSAFKSTLYNLGLIDRDDALCELVARRVVEIGISSDPDPSAIAERATKELAV